MITNKKINKIINKNLTDLAAMFGNLGFKRGAVIGVRQGDFSETLCTHVKSLEKLYLIDTWDIVYKDPTSHFLGLKKQNRDYEITKKKLSKYTICEMIRKTSLEAVRDIEYESLDFVYIDGSHTFDYVMTDIIEWSKRVRKGGIVSGHDDNLKPHGDLTTPLNIYAKVHGISTLILMDHKKEDDHVPNWWFVK